MAKNRNLHGAKKAKNDEFYTQLTDIEKELRHYKKHFEDKVVFCNCDDPEHSNFWQYFSLNFDELKLKRLIATHYDREKPSYMLEMWRDDSGVHSGIKTLKQNGDFRSEESIELLKQSDIVVTNPPFSLFREYVAQLMEYNKKFVIIGNMNASHYKEIFPYIKDNEIWFGYGFNLSLAFRVGEDYMYNERITKQINDGNRYGIVPGITWFTNLDIDKRHEELLLYKVYQGNEDKYIKYDNYDAINIDKLEDIPMDYYGKMGVPDGIFGCYNPEQFEIIGIGSGTLAKEIGVERNYRGRTDIAYTVNGVHKCPYSRIIIKRKM